MSIVVADILELQPISLGTVVAGRNGLGAEVHSITLIEAPDRRAFLQPNLLALSSLHGLTGDIDGQLTLVRLLDEFKGSGLILFDVDADVDASVTALCDTLNLPLIVLPPAISSYEVMKAVIDRLLEKQAQNLESSIRLYEAFVEQFMNARDDCSSLLSALEKNINHSVIFINHKQKCVYPSPETIGEAYGQRLIQKFTSNIGCQYLGLLEKERVVVIDGVPYLFMPVINKQTYHGTLVVVNMVTPAELERLSLAQTQKVLCAVSFGNVHTDEYRERMQKEYLFDLLHNNLTETDLIISQGLELGFDVKNIGCVIVASPHNCEDKQEMARLLNCLCTYGKRLMPEDFVVMFEDLHQVSVLVHNHDLKEVCQKAAVWSQAVESQCQHTPRIGIGPICHDVADIPFSYRCGVDVVLLSARLFSEPDCRSYDDMILYAALFGSIPRERAVDIVKAFLEPVCKYDRTYNANLEQTFEKLLYNNGLTATVADEMFLHKNTVLQRKNRIISLYQENPFDSPRRLQFELVFLIKKIFAL